MLVVGEIVKIRSIWPIWKLKQIPPAATRRPSNIRTHVSISAAWGNTTPYWIRAWLQIPQCTFEPQKHCFKSLCIRSIGRNAVNVVQYRTNLTWWYTDHSGNVGFYYVIQPLHKRGEVRSVCRLLHPAVSHHSVPVNQDNLALNQTNKKAN